MLNKFFTGAAMALTVLAIAAPAHATTKTTRTANFGGSGKVTFTQHGNKWTADAAATVPAGNYVLSFSSEQTVNGNTVSSTTTDLCHFTMTADANVAGCKAHGKGLAPNWRTKAERPDSFEAEIDTVAADGTHTTVLGPVVLS